MSNMVYIMYPVLCAQIKALICTISTQSESTHKIDQNWFYQNIILYLQMVLTCLDSLFDLV